MRLTTSAYLMLAVTVTIAMPALAAENVVRETTQTTTTAPAAPVVLDSYMKPTVEQTKEVTDSNGNTEKTTAPIIMERHEQVAIPNTETRTTTVHEEKQEVEQKAVPVPVPHKSQTVTHRTVSHRPRHVRHVAYKKPVHKYVAVQSKATQTKAVSEDTTVIKQETIEKPATIIERRDPALGPQ
jgi:hypothetical protein